MKWRKVFEVCNKAELHVKIYRQSYRHMNIWELGITEIYSHDILEKSCENNAFAKEITEECWFDEKNLGDSNSSLFHTVI